MYYSSLRKTLVGTTLSFAAAVALSSVSLGQGFSPSLPPANSTFGSGSKPVHSLPRTTPKLEQPNLGGGSSSKPKTNFGGSSYALPRPTKSQSSSASSFDTRPTTKPSVKLAPSDSFGNLGDDDVETSSSLSDIGSTSSGSGRELFIEICNVKLMQDLSLIHI